MGRAALRKLNFSSGPAVLPEEVLRRAQDAIWDLDGSGIGILEHSHRGKAFGRVLDRTEAAIREVGAIGDEFAVLFVTAGATHHFALVPQNFLGAGETADYCHTGAWSGKAIEEARRVASARDFGAANGRATESGAADGGPPGTAVHLACSSQAEGFAVTPQTCSYSVAPRYVHYTSNETIYGTQWAAPPAAAPAPLVCDASSDMFSRPLPLSGHGLIYAGAQKNLGPSGISLVIARRDFIATGASDLSPLAQYRTYDAERSMHNTPNTFGIWMIGEVCEWIRRQGGLAAMAERNARKAKLLYDALDASKVWRGHAAPDSRSLMNVTFRGSSPELEEQLIARCETEGLSGLRGHRSVGGLRASIYNAFPEDGVRRLVALMHEFEP